MRRLLFILLLVFTVGSTLRAQSDSLASQNWVVFGDLNLIEIKAGTPELEAADRAEVISSRLQRAADKGKLVPDSFRIVTKDSLYYVFYGSSRVMMVRQSDAASAGLSVPATADLYVQQFKQKLENKNAVDYLQSVVVNVLLAMLVLLVLFFVIRYMNRLFRYLNTRLIRSNSKYIKGISIRNYEFLSKERVIALLGSALTIIKWLAILLAVYISLPILFSIFPGTEGIARTLFSWVLDPVRGIFQSLINYLPNLITIAVILLAVRYFVRMLHFLAAEVRDEKLVISGFYPDWAMPTYQILRFVFYAFGFVMIFPYLPGSDSPIFQGVSVFLGLLVSFGSGSAIANAVAGIVITYMRPYKKGDRVKIGDITGDVLEKTLLVTRLRTIKNEEVTVPNSSILNGHTVNYSSAATERGLILHTTITIGYDVPWRLVHELLLKAARATDGIEQDLQAFVLQTSLDDFYVSYQLNAYTRTPESSAKIYSELHAHIQDLFNEAGVEIMSPHYRAARDGSQSTIPANYLPDGYVPPPFNVRMTDRDSEK